MAITVVLVSPTPASTLLIGFRPYKAGRSESVAYTEWHEQRESTLVRGHLLSTI